MVIVVVGNGHGDPSSNPGRGYWHLLERVVSTFCYNYSQVHSDPTL